MGVLRTAIGVVIVASPIGLLLWMMWAALREPRRKKNGGRDANQRIGCDDGSARIQSERGREEGRD